ncbi:V-type ATP synthase subunit I [Marinobacterium mangrovicola]|uniref:V/A-type H+-transporting ATPase subunit I n=1 Tax=Marinobacterium mangrovicola TaxID=1476959 RepID=A0A4R1GAV4_9GAMM|nr:V-type ATP synthase subunit I [Marinobacterium mangrovicola]TCK04918.1 V/A-type H+-transporting ATPase subunit I [Marinobacterium mangrovicola]
MSIRPLFKVTLIGMLEEKAQALDALQSLGLVHIVPLASRPPEKPPEDLGVTPEQLRLALQYLASCPSKRRQVVTERHFDLVDVVHKVLEKRRRRLKLEEQRDALVKRIRDLTPWGSFELPGEQGLYGQRLWFYLVPNYRMKEVEKTDLVWSVVHRDNRLTYVAVIAEDEPRTNQMPVPRTHTGSIPLVQLEHQLQDIEIELELLDGEREADTRWLYLLQRSLAGNADAAERAEVAEQTLDRDGVFAIQGWVDTGKESELTAFAERNGLALMLHQPADDELPPTLLDNPQALSGGEDVVRFYQMPGYRAWDPSRVVFFSFATFFALILSDAGYALMLALVLGFYWKRMGASDTGQRLRILGATLAVFSLVYGVLVGSYFGAGPPWGWLESLKVLDVNDFDSMMNLSIFVGAAHLIIANGINAWRLRGRLPAIASGGWILVIIAGLLLWQLGGSAIIYALGALGLLLVFGCSSERYGRDAKTLLLRVFDGLLALTGLSSMFGDVLSYLRLFALGLASASLALTFNQLAGEVATALPGMGVLLEVLILIVGHLLNFVLAVVSGVIHGLRLNLIEFYNWSLSDEGYLFQPFAKREVNPWIT